MTLLIFNHFDLEKQQFQMVQTKYNQESFFFSSESNQFLKKEARFVGCKTRFLENRAFSLVKERTGLLSSPCIGSIQTILGPLSKLWAGNEVQLTTVGKQGRGGFLVTIHTGQKQSQSLSPLREIHPYSLFPILVTNLPILFLLGHVQLLRSLASAKEFVQLLTSGYLPFHTRQARGCAA